jgi:hypothetical protein
MPPAKIVKAVLPSDSVQKHSSAIHIIGDLGLLERKLINVLLLNAFDELHIEHHTHTLPVVALLEGLDWKASKNLDTIKEALIRIQRVVIVFDVLAKEPKKSKWTSMPTLSFADIQNGILSYRYDKALSNLLAKPDSYAIINVNIQNEFESAYALALYENCYRFYRTGSTGWIPVDTWRGLLNAQNDLYKEFKYFKQRVLQDAIKVVNSVSNIVVEMDLQREKRAVKDIKFKVTLKSQLLLADQAGPSDAELREQPLFAELTEWVGAPLALQWMRDNRDRAQQVAVRVNYMASRGEIKKTKGGLARTLYESNGPIQEVSSKPTAAVASMPLSDVPLKRSAKKDLSPEEIEALRVDFIKQTPGAKAGGAGRVKAPHSFAFNKYVADHAADLIAKRA